MSNREEQHNNNQEQERRIVEAAAAAVPSSLPSSSSGAAAGHNSVVVDDNNNSNSNSGSGFFSALFTTLSVGGGGGGLADAEEEEDAEKEAPGGTSYYCSGRNVMMMSSNPCTYYATDDTVSALTTSVGHTTTAANKNKKGEVLTAAAAIKRGDGVVDVDVIDQRTGAVLQTTGATVAAAAAADKSGGKKSSSSSSKSRNTRRKIENGSRRISQLAQHRSSKKVASRSNSKSNSSKSKSFRRSGSSMSSKSSKTEKTDRGNKKSKEEKKSVAVGYAAGATGKKKKEDIGGLEGREEDHDDDDDGTLTPKTNSEGGDNNHNNDDDDEEETLTKKKSRAAGGGGGGFFFSMNNNKDENDEDYDAEEDFEFWQDLKQDVKWDCTRRRLTIVILALVVGCGVIAGIATAIIVIQRDRGTIDSEGFASGGGGSSSSSNVDDDDDDNDTPDTIETDTGDSTSPPGIADIPVTIVDGTFAPTMSPTACPKVEYEFEMTDTPLILKLPVRSAITISEQSYASSIFAKTYQSIVEDMIVSSDTCDSFCRFITEVDPSTISLNRDNRGELNEQECQTMEVGFNIKGTFWACDDVDDIEELFPGLFGPTLTTMTSELATLLQAPTETETENDPTETSEQVPEPESESEPQEPTEQIPENQDEISSLVQDAFNNGISEPSQGEGDLGGRRTRRRLHRDLLRQRRNLRQRPSLENDVLLHVTPHHHRRDAFRRLDEDDEAPPATCPVCEEEVDQNDDLSLSLSFGQDKEQELFESLATFYSIIPTICTGVNDGAIVVVEERDTTSIQISQKVP